MKEFIVTIKPDADHNQFYSEIENTTSGIPTIPDRAVEIANENTHIDKICTYYLTEEEVAKLKEDERVEDVDDPSTFVLKHNISVTSVSFAKTRSGTGNYANWGLKRCNSATNNYGTSFVQPAGGYDYTLDGTGVDVVVTDSGIEPNHPEWQDSAGNSRLQQINWFTVSGVSGTQSANFYRDLDGHGTHVTGIVAGKTFGWAKNARIYSLKIAGLEGSGDSGTGIGPLTAVSCIIGFHNNKAVDPITGLKRPTIVNMSWEYIQYFSTINKGVYRETPYNTNTKQLGYGMVFGPDQMFGQRYSSADAAIESLLSAGIHVVHAAGNDYQKIDIIGGIDYNNYYEDASHTKIYYHRGASPHSPNAITVGAINDTAYSASLEQRVDFSNTGPGVDIWAPGSYQMSALSTVERFTALGYPTGAYYPNNNYKQALAGGTSMASPQVCGLAALYLQINPTATPAQLKNWLLVNSKATLYSTGLDDDYTSTTSLMGGNNRMLYNPFNSSGENLIGSGLTFQGITVQLA